MYRLSRVVAVAALAFAVACKKKPEVAQATLPPPPPPAPVVEAPPPAPVQQIVENFSRVNFDYDSANLTAAGKAALDANARLLQANPGIKVEVQGHADDRGTTEYNLALGQKRANAVRGYLVKGGVTTNRVTVVSFGEERPLVDSQSETAWSENRRAEFRITWGEAPNLRGTVN